MKRTSQLTRTTPLARGGKLKRGKIKPRRYSKTPTRDGDAERAIRDECDALVRTIIALRDKKCVNFGCRETLGLHVGHYIKRGVLSLRWDLRNCNAQCDHDNQEHNTNPYPYQNAMILKYGIGITWKIEELGRKNPRLEYSDLITIRDGLRQTVARGGE